MVTGRRLTAADAQRRVDRHALLLREGQWWAVEHDKIAPDGSRMLSFWNRAGDGTRLTVHIDRRGRVTAASFWDQRRPLTNVTGRDRLAQVLVILRDGHTDSQRSPR